MEKPSRMGVRKIRRIALGVLLTLLLTTHGLASIRGMEWGMSKAQVKQLEGKPETEAPDRLLYEDRVGGLETEVIYLFNHREELYSIEYHFLMERSYMMVALEQFDRISKILHESYGPPVGGEFYSDREKRIGVLALEKPISEEWKKGEETYIHHTLREKGVYKHTLTYGHRALTDEYEEFRKQKEMEKF